MSNLPADLRFTVYADVPGTETARSANGNCAKDYQIETVMACGRLQM